MSTRKRDKVVGAVKEIVMQDGNPEIDDRNYATGFETMEEIVAVRSHQLGVLDLKLIFKMWDDLRGERLAPSWSEIDLTKFPFARVSRCTVVDFDAANSDFVYRFWGSQITDQHNQELTGRSIFDMRPRDVAEHLVVQYTIAKEACRPTLHRNRFLSAFGLPMEEIALRLPLSADNNKVDKFICAFDFTRPAAA